MGGSEQVAVTGSQTTEGAAGAIRVHFGSKRIRLCWEKCRLHVGFTIGFVSEPVCKEVGL